MRGANYAVMRGAWQHAEKLCAAVAFDSLHARNQLTTQTHCVCIVEHVTNRRYFSLNGFVVLARE